MFSMRLKALATASLLALAIGEAPSAVWALDTVELNTSGAITAAAVETAITDLTNPALSADGTATDPTFTATGAGNSVVTINGTLVAADGFNALSVQGDNSHGAADTSTAVTFTGAATGTGTGSGILINTTGMWNEFTLTSGASAASGAAGSSAAFLLNAVGTTSMIVTNHGSLTGAGGMAAFREAATTNSDFTLTTDGVITADSTGNAIDMRSAAANHDISITVSGGSVTATGSGSAIYLANQADHRNEITVSGGTVSSASAAAAIDVSNLTNGSTTITLNAGTISGNNLATGTALLLGDDSDIVDITGGVITGRILTTGHEDGTITFNAASGFTTNGDLGQSANRLYMVSVNGGSVTFANNVYTQYLRLSGTVTLDAATVNTAASDVRFGGGALNLGTNTLSVGMAALNSITAGTTLNLTIGSTSNGKITSTAFLSNNLAAGGQTVTITPAFSGFTGHNNDKFVVFGGMSDATNLALSSSGGLLTGWDLSGTGVAGTDAYGNAFAGNNILLTYRVTSASTLTGVTTNEAAPVNAVTGGNETTNVLTALQALTTAPQVAQAGDRLRTEINRGSIEGATAAVNGSLAAINQRQNFTRGRSGFSSGSLPKNRSAWIQGFGFAADQGARSDANGYNALAGGVVFGMDRTMAKHVRGGAAFTYARTSVEDTGANTGNTSKINSYQGTLYGSYNRVSWYVDGSLSFGFHEYDTKRDIIFSGFSDAATGKHEGLQYTANISAGYLIPAWIMTITPVAGMTFTRLDQNAYKETASNGSALSVDSLSSNSLRSMLGAKFAHSFGSKKSYQWTPEVRTAWAHEFIKKALTTNASFINGGASFTTTEVRPAQDALLLGAGLTLKTTGDISLTANYDAEIKDAYIGHTGSLRLKTDF